MNTRIEEIDGKFMATLEGEMDTAAAVESEEVLKPLYQSNGKDVIIDCTNLEYRRAAHTGQHGLALHHCVGVRIEAIKA